MFPVQYYPTGYYTSKFFPPGGEGSNLVFVSISDNVSATDLINTPIQFIRSVDDSVGVSDVATSLVIIIRTIQDQVGSTDSLSRIGTFNRIVLDVMTPQDVISRTYDGRITLFDSSSYTDSIVKGQSRSLTESVGLSDFISTARQIKLLLEDSAGVSDTSQDVRDAIRRLSELINIEDVSTASLSSVVRSLNEVVGISDAINAGFLISALLSDDVTIQDSIIAFLRETNVPCFVNLTETGQATIVDLMETNPPMIRTASGVLIPGISSRKAEEPEVNSGKASTNPIITGKRIEGDCDD